MLFAILKIGFSICMFTLKSLHERALYPQQIEI